jgi:hypothetical protein
MASRGLLGQPPSVRILLGRWRFPHEPIDSSLSKLGEQSERVVTSVFLQSDDLHVVHRTGQQDVVLDYLSVRASQAVGEPHCGLQTPTLYAQVCAATSSTLMDSVC